MCNNKNGLEKLLERSNVLTSGYVHTAREILSQPTLWRKTFERVLQSRGQLNKLLRDSPRLVFSGAGSSHFVGVSIAAALKKVFISAEAISSTDIVMDPESAFPKEDFILVSFARSGNSPEGNEAIALAEKLCKERVTHLVITCNVNGELSRIGKELGERGLVLDLPKETNDKGLAMTSSFTSMVLSGLMLEYAYKDDFKACETYIENLCKIGEKVICEFDEIAQNVSKSQFSRLFFISSRPYFGGALEAHLKVQELSGGNIVAYASDTLGFRHGFMASVNDESIIVLTSSSNPTRKKYELDMIRELHNKKMGKQIIVIADSKQDFKGYEDIVFEIGLLKHIPDEYRSIITVLVGQLIGFYTSLEHGLEPDSPSPKGIINRVVDGITIHPYVQHGERPNG